MQLSVCTNTPNSFGFSRALFVLSRSLSLSLSLFLLVFLSNDTARNLAMAHNATRNRRTLECIVAESAGIVNAAFIVFDMEPGCFLLC